jgi:heptosyltransferase-2
VQKLENILIIQTAFLGDVILTTPLVKALKINFPDSHIDFLTIPASVNVLENNPAINKIIVFDKRGRDHGLRGLINTGKRLAATHYDLCVTPHRSLRSAYLSYACQAKMRIGFDRSAFKWVFTNIITYRRDLHEIKRNLSLLQPFNATISDYKPHVFPSEDDKNYVDQLIKDKDVNSKSRIFAIAPGSIWPTKRWPEMYFAEICSKLVRDGMQPLLIGGSGDKDIAKLITDHCPETVSLIGELTLRQSMHLLTRCTGLLTNDSAPLHLGEAAGIPVFAIFGATVPEFGFAPLGEKSRVIEYKDLKCRPCGIHGGKKCPTKTFDCMLQLTPDQVFEELGISNL